MAPLKFSSDMLHPSSLFCLSGLHCQLLSLRTWHTAQAVAAVTPQEQHQQSNAFCGFGRTFAGLAAGFAVAAVGFESHCEASSYAIEPANRSWWSRLLHRADPRQLFQNQHEQNIFLEEMQDDPKVCYTAMSFASIPLPKLTQHNYCLSNAQVSVVLALALPFLSLSFGYIPAKHDLDKAAELVQANVQKLDGWEISSLLWAAARLGYRPADHVTEALLQQVLLPRLLKACCHL